MELALNKPGTYVLKVNGETKSCPMCWESDAATTDIFQRLKTIPSDQLNLLRAFSVLIGQDYTDVANSRDKLLEAAMYQCASFVLTQDEYFRHIEPPKVIKLRDKNILIPRDMGELTIEQNMHIRKAMYKPGTALETLISFAMAVYLQPLVDEKPFNLKAARELEKEILSMPISKTFPIGFFFLSKLNESGQPGLLSLLLRKMRRLNSLIKLQSWLGSKSLNLFLICLLSILTQIVTVSYQEKSCKNHLTTSYHSLSYGIKELSIKEDLK